MPRKSRAGRNRTVTLSAADRVRLGPSLVRSPADLSLDAAPGVAVLHGDYGDWLAHLPPARFDLLMLDPPYNRRKAFNGRVFNARDRADYTGWLDRVLAALKPLLKPTATVYICGDWYTSLSIYSAASAHFFVRNRITWQREKGRGARANWKNVSEDVWFCTVSDEYTFNVNAVKERRHVRAPYTDAAGRPKDWQRSSAGRYRDTHPGNIWTDISVPFWSMPENTDHPTQKSEKWLAKLLLASTNPGDWVLDPFLGSGTTAVTAYKLNRRCVGIEIDEEYGLLTLKRLEAAAENPAIQGYVDGVFWPRNSSSDQNKARREEDADT